jgi:hypothetical protein
MPSRAGSKNKKTLAREAAEEVERLELETRKEIARRRAAIVKAEAVDPKMPLESLLVLEEVMRHFYFKAKILESMGEAADWRQIDQAMDQAGKWAKEVAVFRHAKLSAVKLSGDPNAPVVLENMTMEQLRQEIMQELGRLAGVLDLDAVILPQGIENRPVVNGDGVVE